MSFRITATLCGTFGPSARATAMLGWAAFAHSRDSLWYNDLQDVLCAHCGRRSVAVRRLLWGGYYTDATARRCAGVVPTTSDDDRVRGRKVELEGEARTPVRPGFDLHGGAECLDETTADRQAETCSGEVVAALARALTPERLVQRGQRLGRDAGASVPHGEADARCARRLGGQRDAAGVRELERVRRQVEQDAIERNRMTDAVIRFERPDRELQFLLLGGWPHEVVDAAEDLVDREG